MKTRKKFKENSINVKLSQFTLLQRFGCYKTATEYRHLTKRQVRSLLYSDFYKYMDNDSALSLNGAYKRKTRRSCDRKRRRRQNTQQNRYKGIYLIKS